ncbi:MAG TPA: hypothetical protein VFG04_10040 [Planctomycetaceae bacterium]|jgi:hypothetical protein|nr:hypothetical protein [Planctomycetaceae bacterium]
MPKLPLQRIEELVEDSVFHPSPCKLHRERVLRSAVQAAVHQKISRGLIAAVSAGVVVLGLGIVIVRLATSSSGAVSETAAPVSAAAANVTEASATPASASPAVPAAQPTSAGSMGEGLYRSSNPPDGQAPAPEGR